MRSRTVADRMLLKTRDIEFSKTPKNKTELLTWRKEGRGARQPQLDSIEVLLLCKIHSRLSACGGEGHDLHFVSRFLFVILVNVVEIAQCDIMLLCV